MVVVSQFQAMSSFFENIIFSVHVVKSAVVMS